VIREALLGWTQFDPTFWIKKMLKGNAVAQHHAFEFFAQVSGTTLASISSPGEVVARPAIAKAARTFFRSISNRELLMESPLHLLYGKPEGFLTII
jgi:hypothetical protein